MIELIVFDMAGTTVNEDNVVYKTVRAAINEAGYNFTQEQVQEAGAGKEKSQAIRDVLSLDGNVHSDEEVTAIFDDFRQRLTKAYRELEVCEHAGASELFNILRHRGIKIVLNTGYDRPTAENLIEKIGWVVGREIDALVTASDVADGRPGPAMIHRAMKLVGIEQSKLVAKIGDSKIDIEEGQNAKCGMTFGITTGAQNETLLLSANPTHVIHSLPELVKYLPMKKNSD